MNFNPHYIRILLLFLTFILTACAAGAGVRSNAPELYTYTITVDKAGNITSMTDARGVVTNYTYDAINRLTDVEYPSDATLDIALTYDSATGCGTGIPLPPNSGEICPLIRDQILSCIYSCRNGEVELVKSSLEDICLPSIFR